MAHCVNKKHPENISLAKEFNLDPEAAAAVIAVWQERTGEMDRFPTIEEFSKELEPVQQETTVEPQQTVKEGVAELFESNPELANTVYEALGFKTYRELTLEQENNPFAVFVLVKNPDGTYAATTRAGDRNEKDRIGLPGGKVDPNENPVDAAYRESKEEGFDIKNITGIAASRIVDGKPVVWYYAEIATPLNEYKEKKRGIKPISVSQSKIANSGYGNDFIGKQITPQQKQQAQQLYAQYLSQNSNGSIEGFKNWIKNNQSNVRYQKQIDLQAEQDSVLEEFANSLFKRFNISFDLVSEEEARAMFPKYTNEPAFFDSETKKAYLVKGKANKTSAIHEIFTHPFLLQIEKTNPTLYKNLLKEAKNNKSVVDYVDNFYGTNQNNDHEYIARAIDLAVQGELDQQKNKTLLERIQDFFNQLSDYLKKLFNIPEVYSSAISPNITLQQLAQFAMYGKGKMNLNPAQKNIEYSLKATDVIVKNLDKIKQWEKNKSVSEDVLWNKIQGLGVPKEQLELIKNSEGNTVEEKLLDFVNQYSYTVEINTAKEKLPDYEMVDVTGEGDFQLKEFIPDTETVTIEDDEGNVIGVEEVLSEKGKKQIEERENRRKPTQYYSNLTVPGGTNYTENEIVTPAITPSIKGHAQFATDKGIGWFRSDEQVINGQIEDDLSDLDEGERYYAELIAQDQLINTKRTIGGILTKNRRILEVQSDLFQKGRKEGRALAWNKYLLDNKGDVIGENPNFQSEQDFLNLLGKDNNWVTFFIKSIIQDSAKKGYEKVLFPTGNTASKVEGHSTLEEFKKQKEDRIKELEDFINNPTYDKIQIRSFDSQEQQIKENLESANREINQLKQELERIEREGFGALRPIWNFYENTITNILKKQGYNPVLITDEYGNTWNEVTIDENRDNQNIVFQKQIDLQAEQDHILSSKQDIEGFKQFVKDNSTELQLQQNKKLNQEDPLIRDKYFKDSNTTTSTDILTKISESNHPLNRLAEHLIKYAEVNNVQIELVPTDNLSKEESRKVAGVYIPAENKIEIAEYSLFRGLSSEPTILHEILHSLLYNKLNEDNTAQRDLDKLFEYAKQQSTLNHYGLKNIHEFVSELFTNSKFIKELTNIPPSKEVGVYKNFLSEILDYILGLFNINVNDNLYSQSFAVVTNLLEEVRNETLTSEQISEIRELYDVGELLYSESKQNRPIQPSKAIVNNNTIIRPNIKTVKNEHVKPAVITKGNVSNYISEINSPNKKYITNKYFRYSDWGRDTVPYYPYSYGNTLSNQLYVNRINSEFTTPVVFYDVITKTIQFTDNIDKAISVEEVEILTEEKNRKEIQEMEKRMSEIQEETVGQEDIGEILFLEISPEEQEVKEKREQEKSSAQKTIERKEQLIRLFNKKISEGSPRRAELKARISLLEDQIAKLQAKESDAMVMEIAREDIQEIEKKLNSIHANLERAELLDEHQLWNIISELNEVAAYINGWHNISEYILDNRMFPEIRDEIRKLAGTFNDLNRFRKDLHGVAFLNHSSKTSFKKFYQEDLLKRITDEGKLSRWTLGAKHSPSEYVRIINDHFNKAAYNINKEAYEKRRELDLWLEKLKNHTGLSSEIEISKIFLQYYSNGKWTGNYIGRIRQEYFDEKHKLLARAKETGKKEDWKKYYDFLKANSTQMTKDIYEKGTHPDFTKEDFDRQKRLLELYEEHKSKFAQSLIDSGRFEEGSEPFIQAVSEWILLNSPWETTYPGNKGWEYRIHEKPNSARWKDPNFTKIEKDPVLMGFYEFLRNRFYENNKELPHLSNYQSNYLPEMRKTSMEVFTENKGMTTAMSLLRDELIKVVSEAADSEIDSRVVIGGTTYKSIPIGMMGNQLTPEEKSQNIFQVVRAHTLMSLNYKYKSEVEPLAKAAMDLLEETEAIEEVNIGGKTIPKKTVYGDVKTKTPINTIERLQYLIDATLYEERKATEYKGKKEKTLSTGQKVVFSQAKAIDSLIKFTYVKALSIPNFMTPTVNLVLGISQNYMYAAAGRNIDSSSLNWAYTKMAQTIKKSWAEKLNLKDAETVISWMRHLNILDDINESAYGDVQSWDRWLTILQSKGEYFNQGAVMMAFLKKNTVKDKDGNDISIIDAFKIVDGTPVWDVDKMGEMTEPLSREIISSDGRGVNMFRLRQKIKGINHYIHGDYASVLEGKKTSLGRSLMLFKTWLFQTWIHRFGREDYDPDLQETVKGRYRSYIKASTLDGLEVNYKQVMKLMLKGFFSRKAFDNLSEVDKDNLIRNLREIQITVALSAAVALLMAVGADDDDELTKKSLNLAINMISRTQSDIMFYVDPNSARSVLNNIIPPVNTLNDLIALASAMGKTIQGDFVYKSGPWKDQNRILVSAARTLPIANGGVKMFNLATQVYSY